MPTTPAVSASAPPASTDSWPSRSIRSCWRTRSCARWRRADSGRDPSRGERERNSRRATSTTLRHVLDQRLGRPRTLQNAVDVSDEKHDEVGIVDVVVAADEIAGGGG